MHAAFWAIVGLGAIPWVIPSGGARPIVARHPHVIFIRLLETTAVFLYVLVADVLERKFLLGGAESALAGWAGLALTLAGVGLTSWAKVVLRGSFTLSLGIRENHELITAGPYARIRHPIYTGILVAMGGGGAGVRQRRGVAVSRGAFRVVFLLANRRRGEAAGGALRRGLRGVPETSGALFAESQRLNFHAADAAFLALAESRGVPYVTAEERFYRKARVGSSRVLLLKLLDGTS